MIKHFCDRCGVQLEQGFTQCVVRFRRGPLRFTEKEIELCPDCIDRAFGEGFTARVSAELADKRKAAEERKQARLANKTSAPPTEATDEWEDE